MIDHENFVLRALEDAVGMGAALQMAVDMTSEQETLIIVTADHSHVMTINGYPVRGNPILGIADVSDMDLLPYTTLMYTNGKGYERTPNGTRPNLTYVDTEHKNYRPMTAVPVKDETHGGDDVPLYARGPMAHLFYGVQEQNYIPHALAYASCVGKDKRNCWYREGPDEEVKTDGGGSNGGGVLSRTAHNVLVLVSVLSLCSKYYVAYFY